MNKLVKVLQEQINKKFIQVEQNNIKRQASNDETNREIQEKNKVIEEKNRDLQNVVENLQIENKNLKDTVKKLENRIEKLESNSNTDTDVKVIEKIIEQKIKAITKNVVQEEKLKKTTTSTKTKSKTETKEPENNKVIEKTQKIVAKPIKKETTIIQMKEPKIIEEKPITVKRKNLGTSQILGLFDTEDDIY